jgi:hypothetical protein
VDDCHCGYITKLKKKAPLLEAQVTLDIREKRRACENRHNREVKRELQLTHLPL